jgi:hypothetical protein
MQIGNRPVLSHSTILDLCLKMRSMTGYYCLVQTIRHPALASKLFRVELLLRPLRKLPPQLDKITSIKC